MCVKWLITSSKLLLDAWYSSPQNLFLKSWWFDFSWIYIRAVRLFIFSLLQSWGAPRLLSSQCCSYKTVLWASLPLHPSNPHQTLSNLCLLLLIMYSGAWPREPLLASTLHPIFNTCRKEVGQDIHINNQGFFTSLLVPHRGFFLYYATAIRGKWQQNQEPG